MRSAAFFIAGMALIAWPAAPSAERASLVIDARSGRILHAQNANLPSFPASLAKLMTLYLIFEADRPAGEEWTVSVAAAEQPPTKLALSPGERIRVDQAVLALIVRSANDVAVVAAEALADSESAFAERMTRKARALGMTRTRFRNATGLPDPDQYTTARDLALLTSALWRDHHDRFGLFASRRFEREGRSLPSTNGFLGRYSGADGVKTGFTCSAGYNLVASAERDGRRLIGVLLGADSAAARDGTMASLLDTAFARGEGDASALSIDDLADARDATSLELSTGIPDACRVRTPEGWTLELGFHPTEREARGAAATVLRSFASLRGGRVLVLPRMGEPGDYRSLVTGLSHENAAATCKTLREQERYCRVHPPRVAKRMAERARQFSR